MNDNYIELTLMPLDADAVCKITGGTLRTVNGGFGGRIQYITSDSRAALPRVGMFIAIRGENFDGNDYIEGAVRNGCRIVLAERADEYPSDMQGFDIVTVPNTVLALGKLAKYYIYESRVKTVAVTGSVGKTTTKEFIHAVLSQKYRTQKTAGNKNNHIGLPQTALKIEPDTEYAVFECGMSALGEIEYLSKIVRPDIGVITNVGSSHLEKLGTRENIARAKLELTLGMSTDAPLIINADEPLLTEADAVKKHSRVITAALRNRNADYRAVNLRTVTSGTVFDLIYQNHVAANVEIPVFGAHNVYDALFAFAVGIEAGMSEAEIRIGLAAYKGAAMRQSIHELGKITVIEDCYNASPESMRASIDVLASMAKTKGGRATALLGDMKELGEHSALMHQQVGVYAAKAGVSVIYSYGELAENIAEAAIKSGVRAENVYVNLDSDAPAVTGNMILSASQAGDILLVKASRSVKAEKVIEYIKKKLG